MSKKSIDDIAAEALQLAQSFDARRARSERRLQETPAGTWCLGIIGLGIEEESCSVSDLGVIRRVHDSPGEIELARALIDKSLLSSVARYSHCLTHEFVLGEKFVSEEGPNLDPAWWVVSALRMRTLSCFLVPMVANYSWSTIAGAPAHSCHVNLLEDVPRMRRFGQPAQVSTSDLTWVARHALSFARLADQPKYRLAADCLTTHPMEYSQRMVAASLWSGIEALLGVEHELRFRLSSRLASYLRVRGGERVELYRHIKRLYDVRSKIVHGSSVNDTAIHDHVVAVQILLSELLCKITESGVIPSDDEWDVILLG